MPRKFYRPVEFDHRKSNLPAVTVQARLRRLLKMTPEERGAKVRMPRVTMQENEHGRTDRR